MPTARSLMDEVLTPDSRATGRSRGLRPGRRQPASYDKQFVRDWLEAATVDGNPGTRPRPAPALPADVIARTVEKYRKP